ncbi:MAG: hypothetical protein HY903_00870 [Deltaproteobacteria bacterium]|nr:hypothetical protein [Deltaproteobacteria bacterium]
MSFDPRHDSRRLFELLLLVASVLFAGLAIAAAQGLSRPWKAFQAQFVALGLGKSEVPPGIVEVSTCDGDVDRCTTCHLGAARLDLNVAAIGHPFRSHRPALGSHTPERMGCTACHGGVGRALDVDRAHALAGTAGVDPLLKTPFVLASCGRCHVPGDRPGTETLVQGALLYLQLGCAICHSLTAGGIGAWDDGPELRALGRRSKVELETSLFEPAADFPESTMPSYEPTFEGHPEELTVLSTYVQALTLTRLPACATAAARDLGALSVACSRCHLDGGPAAGVPHRCSYILERKAELRCRGCHGAATGKNAAQDCPVVAAHRPACVACHWGSETLRR